MTMHNNGLSKLTEECGEVLQVVGKLNAYPNGNHPDREKNLFLRLEEEIADVKAAISFVEEKLRLNKETINARTVKKLNLFWLWDDQE